LLNGPYDVSVEGPDQEIVVHKYDQNCIYDKSLDLIVRTCKEILPGQEAVVDYGNDSIVRMFGLETSRKRKMDSSQAEGGPSGPRTVQRDRTKERSRAMKRELSLILDGSTVSRPTTTAKRDRVYERSSALKKALNRLLSCETSINLRFP
jgi:hypothetical protein